MVTARNRLMRSGSYLGDPSICSNFQWLHEGCGHMLVHVPKLASEVILSLSAPTSADDNAEVNCDLKPDIPLSQPNEPAILSMIVRIDHNNFWLMADGGYLGPNNVCKDILDVKPSCALLNPGLEPMMSDFPLVLQTLQQSTQCCVTPGFSSGKSFFSVDQNGAQHFKLHHILFESLDSHSEDGDTWDATVQTTAADAYSFEHWPLTKERNCAELLALKNTYRILPLPAYDNMNDLIQPLAYRRSLQGAIAEIHFNLLHWGIVGAKHDVYGRRIILICVLVLPTPQSTAGKKRGLPLHLDTDVTPSYKHARV
ncbi:hypothetical protein PISMIDRAFT_13357 [Pisolithus microcarpus 441]|uniref:Uncharacterized protein n=1 Tax=Pisolithus microcarpus 441 TaxID=765257 RepID=A0A0C9Z0P4_9AGAM|nr:hypothetical protein PISMIDRAFT_13357 [Pisolithus microcarpus 441]